MTRYYRAMYKPEADAGPNMDNVVYANWSTDPAQVYDFTSVTPGNKLAGYIVWEDTVHTVTAIPSDVTYVRTVGRNGGATLSTGHTYNYPLIANGDASDMATGNRVAVVISRSRPAVSSGVSTVPAWWVTPASNSGVDGQSDAGRIEYFDFSVADWIANGSPTSVTLGSSLASYRCLQFIEYTPILGTMYTPQFNTTSDAPSNTPGAGSRSYMFIWAQTRTRDDSKVSSAPTGYSGLTGCNIGNISNDAVERSLWTAVKVVTASSDDPGTATAETPSGSVRISATGAVA